MWLIYTALIGLVVGWVGYVIGATLKECGSADGSQTREGWDE